MTDPRRVFVGVSDIASLVSNYAKGFRALGLETLTLVGNRHPLYPDAQYDVVLLEKAPRVPAGAAGAVLRSVRIRLASVTEFWKALRACDIFLYSTGGSVLPGYLDYRLIKASKKSLVVVFAGSEIRHWAPYEDEMTRLGRIDRVRPFVDYIKETNYGTYFEKQERVAQAERWADVILSQPGFAQLQRRPYMRVIAPLDLAQLRYRPMLRDAPLVLHAPSARGAKGTEFVIAAVEQLKAEGLAFDFRLIERASHAEVCRLLEDADVVVDELYSDTVGVLSAEAMATGNTVLTSYFPDLARTPEGCPAIDVHAGNVKDVLRRVILDRAERAQRTAAGRRYVEQHHECSIVAGAILDRLRRPQVGDFTPSSAERFVMPDAVLAAERSEARRQRRARIRRLLRPSGGAIE